MMSVDPGLVDANILVYAVDTAAPQHSSSRALLDAARDPATTLFVTSQILCEFYSIITNARRVTVARSAVDALQALSAVLALPGIHLLPTPARAVIGWMDLLKRHPVCGAGTFACRIDTRVDAWRTVWNSRGRRRGFLALENSRQGSLPLVPARRAFRHHDVK